ncbi:MAG TPA: ATP-binding cassette domain-containing protein, partial [Bacteroidales bacterium]|nr:ATP-binding cassette domain-containing protein [Bacteroidales bacterium]
LREGALVITAPNGYIIYSQVTLDVLNQVCRAEGFTIDIPWKDLTAEQKHIILYGSDKIEIPYGKHPLESRMKWSGITAKPREMGHYKGILPVMETILRRDRNKNILRFVRSGRCRSCGGTRLNEKARSVKVGEHSITDLAATEIGLLSGILQAIPFSGKDRLIAEPVLQQVSELTGLLKRLGLGYLTPDRESGSLSPGDSRRLRLATLAGMDLSGLICIFDEPSVGLHPHDVGQLIGILKEIRDKGNTVVVVEHDEIFLRHADWITDLGPGAGASGGEILFNGTPQQLLELPLDTVKSSPTLSLYRGIFRQEDRVRTTPGAGEIRVEGASSRNLNHIDVVFHLEKLNVVAGVSGSGKSTLVNHTLGSFLENRLLKTSKPEGACSAVLGWETIGRVVTVDQSPIGRTPRSNPATYTGLFDQVRDLFSRLPDSAARGYDKSRFSFNTPGGRCETCSGAGYQQVGMHFLGNVEVLCEACDGRRFDTETLSVLYRGKSISDVLEMTVAEAMVFFETEPKIRKYLHTLDLLGLGYLSLGQRSSTLSGGEAQRIKLAAELTGPQARHTLYIMNEPTTGLHHADTMILLKAFDQLIAQGHTLIVTEHHPAVISAAGHVIDLGPGSGKEGGRVVFEGTP